MNAIRKRYSGTRSWVNCSAATCGRTAPHAGEVSGRNLSRSQREAAPGRVSSIQRLLRCRGLSVPRMELDHAARYRWEASMCGELWQADALHGPMLMNPATGRSQRVIVFGLLDDRSRLIPYLEAGFGET